MTTVVEFLRARIAEDEWEARARLANLSVVLAESRWRRQLAECEAKRRILDFHESWPVMVEEPPRFEARDGGLESIAFSVSQRMAFLTQEEYRRRFGVEPPTSPMLAALAAVYSDHPDYAAAHDGRGVHG